MDTLLETVRPFAQVLIAALPAIVAILIGAVVLRLVTCRVLLLLADKTHLGREVAVPLVNVLRTLISVAAFVLILGVLGFNLGGLWAIFATVLGMIAIGFVAVWSLLSHSSATLLILILRPFHVGDDIEFAGEPVGGRVVDLNFFFTTLLDHDGRLVQIPNNLFFQKTLRRRCNQPGVSLAYQLNSPVPAALPPPPPPSGTTGASKVPEPDPLLSMPDPKSISPQPRSPR